MTSGTAPRSSATFRSYKAHAPSAVAVDPSAGDVVDRRGVEIVQLLPARRTVVTRFAASRTARCLLTDCRVRRQLAPGLPGAVVEAVQRASSARVSQRPEDLVRAAVSASWR